MTAVRGAPTRRQGRQHADGRRWHRLALPLALLTLALLVGGCAPGSQTGWQGLGPTNSDAVIVSLAADPFQSELVYAGGSTGTVYRARGDTTGAPITSSAGIPPNTSISALLPDPHKAGTVYAGTSAGVYVTDDYGDNWRSLGTGLPPNDTLDALAFGADTSTIFAGSAQHGVYVSHDRGQTWQATNNGLPLASDIYVLLWDSASHTLFAGTDGAGLFASADGGQTWTARTTGLPEKAEVFALVELPSHSLNPNGPTLFLGSAQGLFASTDTGQTWSPSGRGLPAGRVLALANDPTIPSWIYAGTDSTVYRSPDGGKNWSGVAPGLAHPISSIVAIANPATHYVVFAGAGQLVRFPPAPGSGGDIFGNIFTWGFVAVLFLLGYYFIRRTRRQVLAEQAEATGTPGVAPGNASGASRGASSPSAPPAASPPTAAMNGHKRPTGSGASGQPRPRGPRPDGNSGNSSGGPDGSSGGSSPLR